MSDYPPEERAPWDPSIRRRIGHWTGEGYNDPPPHGNYMHPNLVDCQNRWILHNVCVAFGEGFGKVESIADMSCGDARIPRSLAEYSGIEPILGDMYPGLDYQGTLQETVPQLPVVELFISTNTIEHLEDPDADLKLIRAHCRNLLLACPIDEWDAGGQHMWAWLREGVEEMFQGAGFEQVAYCEVDTRPVWEHYKYGIWACR